MRSFLYKYIKLHKMATGIQARDDYDLRQKLHFLKRLRNTRIANKIGRSAEFKEYNRFSLAMCFGRALEMEGEFQVGEKCIAQDEPGIMSIDIGQMTDQEICQMTKGNNLPGQKTGLQQKFGTNQFNPNPCFRCGLPGHKAAECAFAQKAPEVGGKIHHFLETQTPVDKELWAEFFNKCVKAQTAKRFRRYRKKFQEAVTAAQTTATGAAPTTANPTVGNTQKTAPNVPMPNPKVPPKKVTFAKTPVGKNEPQKGGNADVTATITQPTSKGRYSRKPTVKKEVDEIDASEKLQCPSLTAEEEAIVKQLEESVYFEGEDPETTEPESSKESNS
ncbi:MAG: hypothetical protein MJE68_30985, partial [Proteobacteria bacterium]|nr:hypothetical protein [Pseudomonadota bacterium]